MNNDERKALYSIEEAAKMLDVSRRTIYRLIESKEIKSVYIGASHKIPYYEIKRLIQEGT